MAEGATVSINTVVGRITEAGKPPRPSRKSRRSPSAPPPRQRNNSSRRRVAGPISPLVRRSAARTQCRTAHVQGAGAEDTHQTGYGAFLGSRDTRLVSTAVATTQSMPPRWRARNRRTHRADERHAPKIARHMIFSQRTSAHVTAEGGHDRIVMRSRIRLIQTRTVWTHLPLLRRPRRR